MLQPIFCSVMDILFPEPHIYEQAPHLLSREMAI